MPIVKEFQPDLIIISAGFDSARGDPLGGCDVLPKGKIYELLINNKKILINHSKFLINN